MISKNYLFNISNNGFTEREWWYVYTIVWPHLNNWTHESWSRPLPTSYENLHGCGLAEKQQSLAALVITCHRITSHQNNIIVSTSIGLSVNTRRQQMFCENINRYFSVNFSEEVLAIIFQHILPEDLSSLSRVNQLFNFLVNRYIDYIIGHDGNLRFIPCLSCKNYVRVQLPQEIKKTNVFLPHRSISVDKEISLYSPRISIDDLRRRINTGLDESNSIENYSENVIVRSCHKKHDSSFWVNVGVDNCLCSWWSRHVD